MTGPAARSKAQTIQLRDFRHSLPMELLKAREAAMARFRPMLREQGLTEQQWRVIRALAEYQRIDASELAARCFLLAPSLTRILQFLEAAMLISRVPDRKDQRRSFVVLTPKGRRLFDEIAPDSEAIYADIERVFGQQRMNELYALLESFYAALGSEPSS
jgi:homoprotocatechuate degradation regulator HpaR